MRGEEKEKAKKKKKIEDSETKEGGEEIGQKFCRVADVECTVTDAKVRAQSRTVAEFRAQSHSTVSTVRVPHNTHSYGHFTQP